MRGYPVNVKRICRLEKDGHRGYLPAKETVQAKYILPYLLGDLDITHRNQVWSISYIPMRREFMYLYVIMDVYSRYNVGWRLSTTLERNNCTELLDECVSKYGTPKIIKIQIRAASTILQTGLMR